MTFTSLPKSKKNGVATTLSGSISDSASSIPVSDLSVFHDKDGVLITKGIVIGYNYETESYSEEITITGASGTSGAGNLTGATRGVNADGSIGAARAWDAGIYIAVTLSIGVYNLLKANQDALYAALLYGYKELTILQAVVPDANPATVGQGPELANGVNYAWAEFNHSSLQRMQWVFPMPADWDGGNVSAILGWSSIGAGSGTVKWMLKGYRMGDGSTLNATLGALGNVTDTYQGASVHHVTSEISAFAISGTGNLVVLEVYRDYASDTLSDAARLISIRLKYGRTV